MLSLLADRRGDVKPIKLDPDGETVKNSTDVAMVVMAASDAQTANKRIADEDGRADFLLSTDALNFHRVFWRLREEFGEVPDILVEKVKVRLCTRRGYDREELDAALTATKDRPRLPYGWTAMDVAARRLASKPVRLLDSELNASRYARGIICLAVHLQELQKDAPILLPVDQVRIILQAKKVVVAGTLTRLIEMGLLEMVKAEYHTGSAREFRFRGVEGKDFVFETPAEVAEKLAKAAAGK